MSTINTNQRVTFGWVFTIKNRRLNKTWTGGLRQACAEIEASTLDAREVLNDTDTEVVIRPAQVGFVALFGGEKGIAALREVLPAFRQALELSGEETSVELEKLAAGLDRPRRLSLLRVAMGIGRRSAVEKLFRGLEDVTEADGLGMTPLAYACAYGQSNIIEWAIEKKLPLDAVNFYSVNYCDLAWANKHAALCELLVSAGVADHGKTLKQELRARGATFRGHGSDAAPQ